MRSALAQTLKPHARSVAGHVLVAALMAGAWAMVVAIKLSLHPGAAQGADPWAVFWREARVDFLGLLAMMATVAAGLALLPPPGRRRWLGYGALVAVTALVGVAIAVAQRSLPGPAWLFSWEYVPYLPYLLFRHAALAVLLVAWREFAWHRRRADEAAHQAGLRALALEGELAAARLSLLQAQVEPHFLFNSLANVRRLLRTDPPAASALLAALRRYLEEVLPRLRESRTTLGREAELVRAFLAVHRVRMGERLATDIDVPEELAGREVPPMVLLTLVENAIKHGLQPLVDGGAIHVQARAGQGTLTLTVADTGRGMGNAMGHGTGLANLRARLKATYGSAAAFSLRLNDPRGVVAVVTLPEAVA